MIENKTWQRKILQKINEAFAKSNTGLLLDKVTDDINWNLVGEKTIRGKETFMQEWKAMERVRNYDMSI